MYTLSIDVNCCRISAILQLELCTFLLNYYKFKINFVCTHYSDIVYSMNRSTKVWFSYLCPLDPTPDQVLCALVCKDFSHGQPDVLNLSCIPEKHFTLGGKEGEKERMEREGRERG